MLTPDVNSRVESPSQLFRVGDVSRDVTSFESVAQSARPTEVLQRRWTVVLLSPDVVNLMWKLSDPIRRAVFE